MIGFTRTRKPGGFGRFFPYPNPKWTRKFDILKTRLNPNPNFKPAGTRTEMKLDIIQATTSTKNALVVILSAPYK